jgi:hypothetical protein
MELIALNCNHCGAKLKVKETAKFVTCKHCETQLAIHHGDGAAYTDVVEAANRVEASAKALEEHASALGDQNEVLIVQNEIERVDREWDARRGGLMRKGKDGSTHVPTKGAAIAIGLCAPLLLLPFAPLWSAGISVPWWGMAFMVSVGAFIVWQAFGLHQQAVLYERALAAHDQERADLLAKLEGLRAGRPKKKKKKRVEPDEQRA